MTLHRTETIEAALSRFRDEVLRWNAGFSLISRVDTESRLKQLIEESIDSFDAIRGLYFVNPEFIPKGLPERVQYLDLGSGAGFPGLVWHLLWRESGIDGFEHAGSLLIEPREKRAWFLEHMAALLGLDTLLVGADQWGRRTGLLSGDDSERITGLVSLKALHLTDSEVLAGWRKFRPGAADALVVCRFHPPETPVDASLGKKLGLPSTEGLNGRPDPARVHLIDFRVGTIPHALLLSVYPQI